VTNIVSESVAGIRVRIKPAWEMNLRKELILEDEYERNISPEVIEQK